MADPVATAAINAGGQLAGGAMGAFGEGAANQREARTSATHANTLHEFLMEQVLGGGEARERMLQSDTSNLLASDTSGLEAQANRLITRGQQGLNASLGMSGLVNSGGHLNRSLDLRSQVIGNLAEQINQDQFVRAKAVSDDRFARDASWLGDQFGRTQLGAEIVSNPVFGFFDSSTGRATNQGAK